MADVPGPNRARQGKKWDSRSWYTADVWVRQRSASKTLCAAVWCSRHPHIKRCIHSSFALWALGVHIWSRGFIFAGSKRSDTLRIVHIATCQRWGAVNPSMNSWERGTESAVSVSSTRVARNGKRNLSNCVDLSDVQHGRQALSARLCPRLCPSSERATSHALSNWRPPVMRQAAKREHSGLDPAQRARDQARDQTPGKLIRKQTRCRTHRELLAHCAQR